ncbi:hypothetical protein QZH41_005852 [Actinostola sp. cb2023]|nr:hypothetical protein QZH41_005852 [Actinostola sp. cb2023]
MGYSNGVIMVDLSENNCEMIGSHNCLITAAFSCTLSQHPSPAPFHGTLPQYPSPAPLPGSLSQYPSPTHLPSSLLQSPFSAPLPSKPIPVPFHSNLLLYPSPVFFPSTFAQLPSPVHFHSTLLLHPSTVSYPNAFAQLPYNNNPVPPVPFPSTLRLNPSTVPFPSILPLHHCLAPFPSILLQHICPGPFSSPLSQHLCPASRSLYPSPVSFPSFAQLPSPAAFPSTLSQHPSSKKSELADCLKTHTTPLTEMPGDIDVTIIDGAVVVNMVKPGIDKRTFSEYATGSFIPYIKAQLRHVRRLDVICDEYVENSLKATTRCKRGSGLRQRVEADNRLPRKWQDFLRVDENKRELFKFLAECVVASTDAQKQAISTYGEQVLCSIPRESISSLAPCKHEEADTRMLLHAADAVQSGHNKILLRTVDTDVLVLAVACVQKIQLRQDSDDACIKLWVAFGAGTHLRYIAAHEISRSLNPEVSIALPVFHAFTGCNTVSCFAGRGKKTALATWDSYPDVTTAFIDLANSPSEVLESPLGPSSASAHSRHLCGSYVAHEGY